MMALAKKIIKYALITIAVVIVGTLLRALFGGESNGYQAGKAVAGLLGIIAIAGLFWAIGAAFGAAKSLSAKGVKKLGQAIHVQEAGRAHDQLLMYKRLLDEGILSEEEFAAKSEELKKQIL